jgi:hypothetical protein
MQILLSCCRVWASFTMEHWQFLIQQQGDRSWRTLESPNMDILEGRYRVLARSNRPNTDVEVRVTHFSTLEVPPKRRIQKRSRRTNSEGLIAVIPFTDLKPGIWELRCSGDLMSDILGKSWQSSVYLQVLSPQIEESVQTSPNSQLGEILLGHDSENTEDEQRPNRVIQIVPQSSRPLLPTSASTTEKNSVSNAPAELTITVVPIDANPVQHATSELQGDTTPVETAIKPDSAISTSRELAIVTQSSAIINYLPSQKEEDIDEPVTPVWVKGDTAEQILKSLIDLALPASENLLEDAAIEDSPGTEAPPPLLLTLDEGNYFARWGQNLTINGHVDLKEKTNLGLDATLDLESVCSGELRIELRSPQESQILTQIQQTLPEKILPFAIASTFEIPGDCESKLILADISLYGALDGAGEVMLLASQSFTITADVAELLALGAAAKPIKDIESYALVPVTKPAVPEPEPSVSLGLELLNLVKSPQTAQSSLLRRSPKKSLPPRIDPRALRDAARRSSKLKKSAAYRTPQLPEFPRSQTKMIAPATIVSQPATNEPRFEDDYIIFTDRRAAISSTNFPYLRRLKALPSDVEVTNYTSEIFDDFQPESISMMQLPDELEEGSFSGENIAENGETTFQQRSADIAEYENTPEFVAGVTESQNDFFGEATVPPNPQTSPLIRKWMQTQGYTLPEPTNSTNFQYQDYKTYIPPQEPISEKVAKFEIPNVDVPNVDAKFPLKREFILETPVNENAEHEQDKGEEPEKVENVSPEVSPSSEIPSPSLPVSAKTLRLPPPPPPPRPKIPPTCLAKEIVVDDTENEVETDASGASSLEQENEQKQQPLKNVLLSLAIATVNMEPLPVPQLHLPQGELIAGKSIRIRVYLPYVRPQLAVKLWVEDCQTRWLVDGPHLLTDLLPKPSGELEAMTQIEIPFGCLEIRIEAIAIDTTTQQESHKVSIQRTVIPPGLPNLRLDELMGI